MTEPVSTLLEVLDRFRAFGPEQAAGPFGSPVYVAVCAGLADDPETARLLLEATPAQQIPNLLLAAVHDVLLAAGRAARHPLARYYPTVVGESAKALDAETYPSFQRFCAEYRGQVLDRIRTRSTQTNEPRRAAILLPALGVIAAEADRSLALLEAGAAAGLLLQPNRYGYDFGTGPVGDPASPVQLTCQLLSSLHPPLPRRLPIAWRAGIDLAPVDINDPEAVRWLAALLWPEHVERARDLRAAIELARTDPPRVVRGDMVNDIAPLAAGAPADAELVIFHATSLVYLTPGRRRVFVDRVSDLARRHRRSISLVSFEAPGVLETMGQDLLDGLPVEMPRGPMCVLWLWRFEADGDRKHRLLAAAHPHGRWLLWLDVASAGNNAQGPLRGP
jgi:hypothetical protein